MVEGDAAKRLLGQVLQQYTMRQTKGSDLNLTLSLWPPSSKHGCVDSTYEAPNGMPH